MKSAAVFVLFVLQIALLSSCDVKKFISEHANDAGKKAELQQISGPGYSMGVPTYMSKATTLNDEASLQFQNIFKEAYVIVIDEDKEKFIKTFLDLSSYDTTQSVVDNYGSVQLQSISSRSDVISKKDLKKLKINRMNAVTTELDAKVEGVNAPVSYFLTFVEGKRKLYFIMGWTLQSKKEVYRTDYLQMRKSFKEL